MKIDIQTRDGYMYVEPQERIDSNTSPDFQKALNEAGSPASSYIINFSNVPYMSSAGLRVVMVTAKASSMANGTLILCGLNGIVKEVFEMSGFNNILTICEDVAAAEQLLSK
jgi:anti-anti-sigma factor